MLGQPFQIERFDVRHGLDRCQSGDVGHRRMSAQVEECALRGDLSFATTVETDCNSPGSNEARFTHDQLGSAGRVPLEMHLHQALDHLALAGLDTLHVRPDRIGLQTELSSTSRQGNDPGTVNDVLAR